MKVEGSSRAPFGMDEMADQSGDDQVDGNSYNINFFSILAIQTIVEVCIVVYALYFIANYAHSGDTKFGRSTLARVYCIIGIVIYLTLIVYVPVDITLTDKGQSAQDASRYVWEGLIFGNLLYIWGISPVMFAFYETSENDGACRRLWDAIRL